MADARVNVELNVKQTGDAARQMKDLATLTDQAAKAQRGLNEQRARSPQVDQAAARANPAAPGGGLLGSGGLGGLGALAPAAVAGAVLAGIQQGMSAATSALNRINDPASDATDRARAPWEAIPVVGGLVKTVNEFRDAISGATGNLKRLQIQLERNLAVAAIQGQQVSKLDALAIQQGQVQAGVIGQAGAPRAAAVAADRSTVAGERRQAELERMLPAQLELRRADAEGLAAKVQQGNLAQQIRDREASIAATEDRARQARARYDAARDDASAGGKQRRGAAVNEELVLANNLVAQRKELMALVEQQQQAIARGVQSEAAQQKALLALSQARLQTLTETEGRVRGQAQAFGSLTAAEQQAAVQSAKQLKEKGLASLSADQRALLQRAGAGDRLAKEFENAALKNDRFREFQDAQGERADLDAIRKERNVLQAEVVARVQLDEEAVARKLSEAMDPVFRRLKELVDGIAAAEKQKVEVEKRQRFPGFFGF